MSRKYLGPLLEFDPEIEKSLLARHRELQLRESRNPLVGVQITMEGEGENQNRVPEVNAEVNAPGDRPLHEFIRPCLNEAQSSIRRPPMQANNLEIKHVFIQMIQNSLQFSGLSSKNPNDHLIQFLELCDTFKHNGASEDAIRLRLFPFSLRDRVRAWLNSFPSNTFIT